MKTIKLSDKAYWAVLSILNASEQAFYYDEEEGEYCSNSDFICSLSKEEYEALKKNNWSL